MSEPLTGLRVIPVRYRGSHLVQGDERSVEAIAASGVYRRAGVPVEVVEPAFPENRRVEDEPTNLGTLGGVIADLVAQARREGRAVLLIGGNCTHCTGVLGGLQDVHGPAARIGLIWFDAHGDFNTPRTTLSGSLGGMPVAVCAGLAHPQWRERSHIAAPLATDRIVLVDVRNLDPAEEQLIRATDATIASPAAGFPGADLRQSVAALADCCDLLYLHIDSDVLDRAYVPNHGTREPNGPNVEQVRAAIDVVMATGKVVALAVVSIYGEGPGCERSQASAVKLIEAGLQGWCRYGLDPVVPRSTMLGSAC